MQPPFASCPGACAARQRAKPSAKRGVQPLDVRRVHLLPRRQHLRQRRRAAMGQSSCHRHHPMRHPPLHHLPDHHPAHGSNRGRPRRPVGGAGVRVIVRNAATYAAKPSTHRRIGPGKAAAWTSSIRRRISAPSRCGLTTPPSHHRVETIIAIAIQTTPPCRLTRSSSARHLPQITRHEHEMLMHLSPLLPCRVQPITDRLPPHPEGDHHRSKRTAMCEQRQHRGDRRFVGVPPIKGGTGSRPKGLATDQTAVARRGTGMDVWMCPSSQRPLAGQSGLGQNTSCGFMESPSRQRGFYWTRFSLSPPLTPPLSRHLPEGPVVPTIVRIENVPI